MKLLADVLDSESEEWMMAGMAVRMAIDLGLHQVCQTVTFPFLPNDERITSSTCMLVVPESLY